jgi:hypothetical protein
LENIVLFFKETQTCPKTFQELAGVTTSGTVKASRPGTSDVPIQHSVLSKSFDIAKGLLPLLS